MIILFGLFVRYDEESDAHWSEYKHENNITSDIENEFYYRYSSECSNSPGIDADRAIHYNTSNVLFKICLHLINKYYLII